MLNKNRLGTTLSLRLPLELEQQLSLLSHDLKHANLSQTCRFFIKLGIKSHLKMKEIQHNPELKEKICSEWQLWIEKTISQESLPEILDEVNDDELLLVLMSSYNEIEKRRSEYNMKKFEDQTFPKIKNQIENMNKEDPFYKY